MTLIVGMSYRGVPVIISDLMISRETLDAHTAVSTYDNLSAIPFNGPQKIAKLSSKIYIISKTLVISWAGGEFFAKGAISDIKHLCSNELSLSAIKLCFEQRFDNTRVGTVFIGCLIIKTEFVIFRFDTDTCKFESGLYFSAGSGSASFEEDAQKRPEWQTRSADPTDDAVGNGIYWVGHFLGKEILRGENLAEFFGGGFDVVFYDGTQFRRVGRITQIFLDIKILDAREPMRFSFTPRTTSFWQSIDNGLNLERIDTIRDPEIFSKTQIKIAIKNRKHITASIDSSLDISDAKISVPYYLNIYYRFIINKARELGYGVDVYRLPNTDIKITEINNTVFIRLSTTFLNKLTSMTSKFIMNPQILQQLKQEGLCD